MANLRRHPIYQLLNAAGSGSVPSEAELDQLELPPTARRKVAAAATAAASIKAAGENQRATDHGRSKAMEILRDLAPEHRDSDYLRDPEPPTHDPAELAAPVRRW